MKNNEDLNPDKIKGIPWHTLEAKEVLRVLDTSEEGLSEKEAENRLAMFGYNRLEEYKTKPKVEIFIDQFKDFVVGILIVAAIISLFIGLSENSISEIYDSILIIIILIVNALIGTYQELRAEKAIVSLKKYIKLIAKVRRNGKLKEISSEFLVPGDIVLLDPGSKVPADMRLIFSSDLYVDESLLTGESLPVAKDANIVLDEDTVVSDRLNMVYSGTVVTHGHGVGVVVATGSESEFGKIAKLIREIEVPETPIKAKTKQLGKQISIIFVLIITFVFFQGLLLLNDILLTLMTAVSLAVAAVPEGLPVFITLILALSALEMAKKNAIVRNLQAVETLGSTSVICTDKTGTLTENQMTVVRIVTYGKDLEVTGSGYRPEGNFLLNNKVIDPSEHDDIVKLIETGVMCNRSEITKENDEYKVVGDPLEGALLVLAEKALGAGVIDKLKRKYVYAHEIPFTSARKRMSISYLDNEGNLVSFVKGSPEIIIELSKKILVDGEIRDLTDEHREYFNRKVEELAKSALRTLALAFKITKPVKEDIQSMLNEETLESDLVLIGIVGMIDPPRRDAKEFIEKAKKAGINVVMVTGDHALTALAIGKEIGIVEDMNEENVIHGRELDKMGEDELVEKIDNVKIFARVSPEGKVKIVKAFKRKGKITAMTGDGINDAPALKLADVGVAMGKRGSDVAREAADLILVDEKFPTIVKAIEVGRVIYDNIRKTVAYLLSSNIAEVMIIFLAFLFNWPLAMLPIQILWLNLVSDGVPALGLCVDPPESDVMKRPPRDPKEPILRRFDFMRITYIAAVITVLSLIIYGTYLNVDLAYARTMVFSFFVFAELFNSIAMRTEKESVFKVGIFSNKLLIVSILVGFVLQFALIYVPFLDFIFRLEELKLEDLLLAIAASSLILIFEEIRKAIYRVRNRL